MKEVDAQNVYDTSNFTLELRSTDMGIQISVNGDKLKIRAPEGVLTAKMLQVLTDYKPELIKVLTSLRTVADVLIHADEVDNYTQFNSPIEQSFWEAWRKANWHHYEMLRLCPQYPIGKYRVDFAHVSTRTAIELDGFASHSSTEDIARDRKRQREIEAMGWHVIRFGGKEIHNDVSECVKEVVYILATRMERDDIALTR